MKTTVTQHEDYVVANLEGTIDESAKASFDEQLHPIIEGGGRRMLIDLSRSERVTSAGVSNLVTLVSRANAKGSRVVLAQPSPFVSTILEATKLIKFFEVEPTMEEAIARLKER